MRNALLVVVVGSLAMALGCSSGPKAISNPVVLTSIQVTAPNTNLAVGQSQQLTATGAYSDHTTQDLTASVSWSSSNTNLATIAAGGMLTAKSSGTASITATLNSVSGSFSLTIAPALVSIAVAPASKSIAQQTTQQFIATGTYSDNSTQNITASVNWSSSNTAAAAISNNSPTKGLAQGVSAGNTTITATSGSISGAASLTVTSATASSLAISPNPANLALDVSQQFTATATFSDGTMQDVTNVATWSSSITSTATITVSGLVTAKTIGTSIISAVFESAADSATLNVSAHNLSSISIQPANTSIAQGTKTTFKAIGIFNDGSTHNLTSQVTWLSSDTSRLNFVSGSQAFGAAPGGVMVTASLGSVTDTIPFTVTNATIVSISVAPYGPTIPIGWHQNFTATGVFSDSSTQDITTSVQPWTSSNPNAATVGSSAGTYGLAVGAKPGTTTISANFSYAGASATGSAPLTVDSQTLSSITVTPNSSLLAPGSGLQYTAKGTWSDGSSQNISLYVTWLSSSSSSRQVASVSPSGLVTGQSAGTATITAQSGSLSASSNVAVEAYALSSIQVTPQGSRLPATIQTHFTAIGTFADNQSLDLTSAATWTSSSSSVATVSNAAGSVGVVTGIAPGSTTISATFGQSSTTSGQTGATTLTVSNATLNSITVTPANPTISLGASQQFAAQGIFSDGSSVPITGQVAWSSSDVGVATINTNGLASSASRGTTTIQASTNGVTGTAILTVQ